MIDRSCSTSHIKMDVKEIWSLRICMWKGEMRIAERNPTIWRHSCMEYSEAEGDVQATGVKLRRCVWGDGIEDVGSIDMLQQFCYCLCFFSSGSSVFAAVF